MDSLKGLLPFFDELNFWRSSGLSVACDGTYLQPALAVLQANLTQGILHCFARLSYLLDVSHWKLIHYSADTLGEKRKGEDVKGVKKTGKFFSCGTVAQNTA